ncbi:PREDICTED: 28S ribosomal protein S9, mitochondrial isoform X2 [Eufriesea mexicana]|uniref:28S ribosomal protein S9, mitochondrial isoform X2 n=1 Tax=Eufriesea mexicana TaxID=516756 RepID=UPI00083BD572|nr:PREDICTED: 28S ribosomal protein S9, mitochondrial isoform X2 [Eufriesea mexicana]
MAVLTLTRFINVRNVTNFNNFGVVGNALNIIQHSNVISKSYSTDINHEIISSTSTNEPEKRMSKAMKLYFQRFVDYNKSMNEEIAKYNIGKRHLANIMGKDVNNFTERDINDAINYLFPSGLYNIGARPMMQNPEKTIIKRKEAEFDESGRPLHFLYYTTKPNYYEILHNIMASLNDLNKMEDEKRKLNLSFSTAEKLTLSDSIWISKNKLESLTHEDLSQTEYIYFIKSISKLLVHPLSKYAESFIMKYRTMLPNIDETANIPKPDYDSEKRPFVLVERCARKNARGQVKVIGNGSGNIVINGQDITYFKDMQCREQIDDVIA